ncbi:MAG: Eco57I restriction-modification methylase domain-containing protein [Candidatus Delongbacteria bacterium]|jgi:adenine-specific DNA-methyltransferase|nr:Eco57I restriction-modification methylase domain-containing protein [Candidatus Delongbacteria bacterium]
MECNLEVGNYYPQNNVVNECKEQLLLFNYNDTNKELDSMEEMELGQVFTPENLARFMIKLISDSITENSRILDPCIGPNTFFKLLEKKCYMKGIEIDKSLVDSHVTKFYNEKNRELITGSFFELPTTEKFNFIIENPPYVRQELLMNNLNAKKIIRKTISSSIATIPSQSNLYVYFLLKSIMHLENNGVMIAVIYDSWLYSNFGVFLKEAFMKFGYLERIFHFKENVFDGVNIGATVIKFIKSNQKNSPISYYKFDTVLDLEKKNSLEKELYRINQKDFLLHSFNNKSVVNEKSNFFTNLKSISTESIKRGTSGIVNKYFIFSSKTYKESVPLIKNVINIKTFRVDDNKSYILSINDSISQSTYSYIEMIKQEVLSSPNVKYKALKNAIALNKNWYKVKLKSRGNLIFNYYLRNNIDFIFNPNNDFVSDNFYSLNVEDEVHCHLAILNSTFTKLEILKNSRSQGNGLRKIQLYEFEKVKVVDFKKLSKSSISILKKLGNSLLEINRYNSDKISIIKDIDLILLAEYNKHNEIRLKLEDLENELRGYRE